MPTIEEALQAAWKDYHADKLEQAVTAFYQIVAQVPERADVWHLGGVATLRCGRRDLAIEYLGRALKLNPDLEPCRFDLAAVYRSLGFLDEAAGCYRELVLRSPNPLASQWLAKIHDYQRFNQLQSDGGPSTDPGAVAAWIEQAFQIGMMQISSEITRLAAFLHQQAPVHVMEIGSLWGGSFFLWCRLSRGKKIALDLPYPDYAGHAPAALELRAAAFRRWAPNVFSLLGDSHDEQSRQRVAEILAGDQLDFLLIDGDHSYEGVKADYQMYSPFVRPGGWIAFHDVLDTDFHRQENCHVSRFWQELAGEKQEITANEHWGGIGLIRMPLA